MQHSASATLSWSAHHQVYELSDTKLREVLRVTSEDPAWFAWLDEVSSFAFHGQSGYFTARKETKQRGTVYWYAYRKTRGTLAKKYLGKTADLTLTRLEDVAGALHASRATAARTNDPAPSPSVQHETILLHAHIGASAVTPPALPSHTPSHMHTHLPNPLLTTFQG